MLMIYEFTVIFSLVQLLVAGYSVKKELKLIYTKEQLKEYKKRPGHSVNPMLVYFTTLCPILNILAGVLYILKYNEILEKILEDYKKELGTQ